MIQLLAKTGLLSTIGFHHCKVSVLLADGVIPVAGSEES
ncbi:hypothetical protein SMD11_0951 [Streptomyces albireticuli]|uniref:Uncharacterized protein n=1 Tax=Streptomyces albireticuli TaxID=1940 RepID=A0A1Z2KX51_9ACTN|nr:hypothetical protein SMD11_0951 [Streptomyces albireticuli]